MRRRPRAARGTTFGGFGFAALLIAVASGVALALPFDAHRPYDSVALLLLTNPGARFYRNVHYLAAQAFLLLTLLHAIDHLRRQTERRLTAAMWARVTLSLPVAAFLMVSGFVLKGDAEGAQALRILSTLTAGLPLVGEAVRTALFGPSADGYQVIYLHHAATATILVWLIVAEHARSVWPRAIPLLSTAIAVAAAGLFVMPTLHDGLDPLVRGPWYFLGLQELLHWTARPGWTVAAGFLVVGALLVLPRVRDDWSDRVKIALAAVLVAYGGVTAFAWLCRGPDWALAFPPRLHASGITLQSALDVPSIDALRRREIPFVLGRREGCLFCHADTRGLSASHAPEAVGCASCHGGDPFSLQKTSAHRGMTLVPGNLSAAGRSCGLGQCHPSAVDRAHRSIMTTMAGVVAVDRAVIGTPGTAAAVDGGTPDRPQPRDVRLLGTSRTDAHVRQLCASCHLGSPKDTLGAVTESSRGGGCNACHLNYGEQARLALGRYQRDRRTGQARADGLVHPDISIAIGNEHCFGCHSRSGRISTSYEGWMELAPDGIPSGGDEVGRPGAPRAAVRTLEDGRRFGRVSADVHFEQGMGCVDCHTAREVMGDGAAHRRKSEQVRVGCEDCHVSGRPTVVARGALDAESQRILTLRGARPAASSSAGPSTAPGQFLALSNGGDPLLNTVRGASGAFRLIAKQSGRPLDLKAPTAACTQGGGHRRLSCTSCHSAWAPRCTGCHTRFDPSARAYDHVGRADVTGGWTEEASDFQAAPPTLGIRASRSRAGQPQETIDTFAPGMVLTVATRDGDRAASATFRRLYARVFPHTISKGSRSCESCHNDPVALGYGRGTLRYTVTAAGRRGSAPASGRRGRWTFTPGLPVSPYDRLPADAWVGFLEEVSGSRSTRDDVRPFSAGEQKRILTVGACLTCHKGDGAVMRGAIADFDATLRRAASRCVLPGWQ